MVMRHLHNPDANHEDCQGVCIPKWAFKVGMGFLYVCALCVVMTVTLVIGMMVIISGTTSQIRQQQVQNAKRFERVAEEVASKSLPMPPSD